MNTGYINDKIMSNSMPKNHSAASLLHSRIFRFANHHYAVQRAYTSIFIMKVRKQKGTSPIPSQCLDEAAVPGMQRILPFSVVDQLCFDRPMPGEFQP